MEARIVLSYTSERYAEAVEKAISPDNVSAPPDLSVTTVRIGSSVVTRLSGIKSIETLMATIDDLLMAVQVVERVISASPFIKT